MEHAGIDLFEAMSTLVAVRKLRADPIPDELLRRVLQAATWAPSGGNRQGWRFLAVTDPALKRSLGELYNPLFQRFAKGYEAAIAAMPEGTAKEKTRKMLDSGLHLGEHFHEAPAIVVVCFLAADLAVTDAKLGRVSVVGGASIYPAVQNLLLACRALGLGGTLTTLLCAEEPKVREILGIPENWATAASVPIGYPVGKGHGPVFRKPLAEVAYRDRWGTPLG